MGLSGEVSQEGREAVWGKWKVLQVEGDRVGGGQGRGQRDGGGQGGGGGTRMGNGRWKLREDQGGQLSGRRTAGGSHWEEGKQKAVQKQSEPGRM